MGDSSASKGIVVATERVQSANPANPLEEAILRTLLYADVFDFPMTAPEIHRYLIGCGTGENDVITALMGSRWLHTHLTEADGYYALQGRAAIIPERLNRSQAIPVLIPLAYRYGRWLARVPFVRMVALTGALAVGNPHGLDDDLDYLIVTKAGRVWLTRAFIVGIVKLAKLRGVQLCPNYVLSESALAQDRHDLYLAHEIVQMQHVAGAETARRFARANHWTREFLPNAEFVSQPDDGQFSGLWHALQRIGEWVFSGAPGDMLERWESRRKLRKFAPEASKPHSGAQLDAEHVKGHFNDYGYPTLTRYQARLIEYGLAPLADQKE